MKNLKENFYLGQDFLSNSELYFSEKFFLNQIILKSEEFHHCIRVMRHKIGDELFITDGKGIIYKVVIDTINKDELIADVVKEYSYQNQFENVYFCIPPLKSNERMEFAIEKCVELGITNFIFFKSSYSINKHSKLFRWEKIALSAMKQSLRAWKPMLQNKFDFQDILNLDGEKFVFEQNSNNIFNKEFIEKNIFINKKNKYLIFGPEGGFSDGEMQLLLNAKKIKLTGNRLRSETAIISAAIILNQIL